jgi:integrase
MGDLSPALLFGSAGAAAVLFAPVPPEAAEASALTPAQAALRAMVLASVRSPHSRRAYAKALDELFAFAAGRPLSRVLLVEWRATMDHLSPATVNLRLSAVRKLVGEARRNGFLGAEEAANLADVPNVGQRGHRMGNWLTRQQARELLAVPDRSTLKGARDYTILALLLGCGLRRRELAALELATLQLREGRWVLADLRGKGGRTRTVAVPAWVKLSVDQWTAVAGITAGRLLRPLSRSGRLIGDELGDWAIWSVVVEAADAIGIPNLGAHDLRRTCAKLCRAAGGELEQIRFLLGHSSIQTTERYLGAEQTIAVAVNDAIGL